MRSSHRDLIEKAQQRCVAVLDGMDRPRREEALLQVPDRPLDAPLVLRLADAAKPRLHMERGGEREQVGLVSDQVALPLEHDGLGIVEEPASRKHERGLRCKGGDRWPLGS